MVPPNLLVPFTISGLAMVHGKDLNHNFPYGPYTARPVHQVTFREAQDLCDLDLSCAGVTYLPAPINDGTNRILAHAFLPTAMNETYKSPKHFTFHAGKVKDSNILEVRHGNMSVGEAKKYCHDHHICVAFFFPVHSQSLRLMNPDNITFVSSIESFEPDAVDEWRTFVANDLSKAQYVNAASLPYQKIPTVEHPFKNCCTRIELPTIEEIEAVDTLERISCNISKEEFYEKYEKPRKPVALVGCNKDWEAQGPWTYERLISQFDNDTEWQAWIGEEEWDYYSWSDIVDAMKSNTPFYVFDHLDSGPGKSFDYGYDWPIPLQGRDLYSSLDNFPEEYGEFGLLALYQFDFIKYTLMHLSHSSNLLFCEYRCIHLGAKKYFCVGNFGSGTEIHMDPYGTEAWNTMIQGHKWWVIYPERILDEEVLFCDRDCSNPDYDTLEWHASIGINAARSEYNDGERPFHVLHKPGETMYIPNGRVHSVFNMDETISITANYGSAANFDEVWKAVAQEENKKHWRKMYEYVLDDDQRRQARESKYWPPDEMVEEDFRPRTVLGATTDLDLTCEDEAVL